MKKVSAFFTALLMAAMLAGSALAATTFDGTVVASETVSVTAPFGGVVNTFAIKQGDQIKEGDVIATVQTTKVYAPEDGTVSGIFGQPGDTVSDVVSRKGAVLYLEPTRKFSITADIQKAYNSSDNKYVNIGEVVYIRSYSDDNDNEAVGVITAVDGTDYTVETTQGELLMGETVSIYRDSAYATKSRIGRGTVSRTAAIAVGGTESATTSGSGSASGTSTSNSADSILTLYVEEGDAVERGQLLYETIAGPLDGLFATGNEIVSDVSGIVATVGASSGTTISKGDTLLTVYPDDKMQVEIEIDEYDLTDIAQGDRMTLSFNYTDATDDTVEGTVASISHISASTDTSDVTYYAYIDFTPSASTRLGMTVAVTTAGEDAENGATGSAADQGAPATGDVEETRDAATE